MAKVLVCDKIHSEGIQLFVEAGINVDQRLDASPEELKRIVKGYDGIIVRSKTHITKEIIENAANLKVIGRAGVGLDNIDVKEAEKRRIKVVNAPESLTQAVAELTIGLMLSLSRMIPTANQTLKKGEWIKSELTGRQLAGKTLGLIGFGKIGFRVAQIAKAMGMRVLAYDIALNEALLMEAGVEAAPLERLLRESDYISVHVPLNPETRGMIGDREIAMMKQGAMIVNTARGSIINEKALQQALKAGKLGGAALDCHTVEPPENLELLQLQNVICTPHIGAQTEEAQRDAAIITVRKMIEVLQPR